MIGDTLKELQQALEKSESKLKMMEISFEQINNSRNDLIAQLAKCEILNKKLEESREEFRLKYVAAIDEVLWLRTDHEAGLHKIRNTIQKLSKLTEYYDIDTYGATHTPVPTVKADLEDIKDSLTK